jgi:hypothetical protein
LRLSDKGVVQRGVVAAAAQGKLPVEKTGAQEMILRHQKINGASVLRGWLMDWLKNSSRSKKGEQKVSA